MGFCCGEEKKKKGRKEINKIQISATPKKQHGQNDGVRSFPGYRWVIAGGDLQEGFSLHAQYIRETKLRLLCSALLRENRANRETPYLQHVGSHMCPGGVSFPVRLMRRGGTDTPYM